MDFSTVYACFVVVSFQLNRRLRCSLKWSETKLFLSSWTQRLIGLYKSFRRYLMASLSMVWRHWTTWSTCCGVSRHPSKLKSMIRTLTALQRKLTVPGLGFPRDIACGYNRCAYISRGKPCVHRV